MLCEYVLLFYCRVGCGVIVFIVYSCLGWKESSRIRDSLKVRFLKWGERIRFFSQVLKIRQGYMLQQVRKYEGGGRNYYFGFRQWRRDAWYLFCFFLRDSQVICFVKGQKVGCVGRQARVVFFYSMFLRRLIVFGNLQLGGFVQRGGFRVLFYLGYFLSFIFLVYLGFKSDRDYTLQVSFRYFWGKEVSDIVDKGQSRERRIKS